MRLPTIYESKIYKKAKSEIVPGDTLICGIPKYYTVEQQEKHLHFWFVKERLLFLRQNLARAGSRGDASQEILVDADYCFSVGEKQGWRCALTGDLLEFERGGTYWGGKWCNPKSCTIDRIDSNLGYVEGNIQLVTWEVNCIKQHFENNEFVKLCTKVADHHK